MVQYPLPDSGDCGTFEANPDKASGPFLNHTRCLPTPTDHPMRPLIYAVVLSLLWYPAISPAQKDVRSSPAKQAGESLAQLIIDQDSEGLTDRIDMKVLLDRVMRGMDLGEKDRQDLAAGFRSSRTRLADSLIKSIAAQHAVVTLVRSRATPNGSDSAATSAGRPRATGRTPAAGSVTCSAKPPSQTSPT